MGLIRKSKSGPVYFVYGVFLGMFVYITVVTMTGNNYVALRSDSFIEDDPIVVGGGDYRHNSYCDVTCEPEGPCEYPDEVELRIMILSYNRGDSLRRTLDTIEHVEMDGGRISVEMWIDRSIEGTVDKHTIDVARNFSQMWKDGRACVHVQRRHQHVLGQWFSTWRPKRNTREIGLILEDDISVSRHIYHWLRPVSDKYRHNKNISTFTLQTQGIRFLGVEVNKGGKRVTMTAPANETVFLYGVIGTWGFAPRPEAWRDLLDFYYGLRKTNASHKPYVPEILPTVWYKTFEKTNRTDTVPEQWVNYYNYVKKTYTLYSNLNVYRYKNWKGYLANKLTYNRKEAGVHFRGSGDIANKTRLANRNLMAVWKDDYVDLPDKIVTFSYNGEILAS